MDAENEQNSHVQPVRKRAKITLPTKLLMIEKYKSGVNLTTIARDLGYSLSTVNTIVKDADRLYRLKDNSKIPVVMAISQQALDEVEKLLIKWMREEAQKGIAFTVSSICAKAREIYENSLGNVPHSPNLQFTASEDWFNRFKERAGFHVQGKVYGARSDGNSSIARKEAVEVIPLQQFVVNDISVKEEVEDVSAFQTVTETVTVTSGDTRESEMFVGVEEYPQLVEQSDNESETADDFLNTMKKIEEEGFSLRQTFYIGECALYWKRLPKCTYISRAEREGPGFKPGKDKITLLLGANVTGCYKLKPVLIYHSANPRALKGICKATLPVHYRSSADACLTASIIEDWFSNCFYPEMEKYCRENKLPFKVVLILSRVPGIPMHLNDLYSNVKVVLVQKYTVCISEDLTVNFRAHYLLTILLQMAAASERDPNLTFRECWKWYNLYHSILNIAEAWEELPQSTVSLWKVTNSQEILDGSIGEKEETYGDVVNRIIELVEHKQLALRIAANDVLQFVLSQNEEMTEEELEAAIREQRLETQRLSDSNETKGFVPHKMMKAFQYISSGLAEFEKMDPNVSRFLEVQKAVGKSLARYWEIYTEKTKQCPEFYAKKLRYIVHPHLPSVPSSSTSNLRTGDSEEYTICEDPLAAEPSSSNYQVA